MGGTKGKKKVKQGKGSEKKNATKKKVNKATASGSSDGDSSAESSAPEEGMCQCAWGKCSVLSNPAFFPSSKVSSQTRIRCNQSVFKRPQLLQ